MRPWRDRAGRLAPLRATVFLALFVPGAWLAGRAFAGDLGARPVTEVIHQTGLWAVRLLFVTLAITPLRQMLRWPELLTVRRMLGVGAFTYAALHLSAYVVDENFVLAKVASEILRRIYLTIGFATLATLAVLAATSTDGMIRRLGGPAWRRLHRLVYPAAILAAVHFYLQAKLNVFEPTWMAGLLVWLLGYRLARWLAGIPALPLVGTALLAAVAALVTFLGEGVYQGLAHHVPAARIVAVELSFMHGVRPGWIVLFITLPLAALAAAWRIKRPRATVSRTA